MSANTSIEPIVQLREEAMRESAQQAVLESGDWLKPKEMSTLVSYGESKFFAQLQKWKRQGKIYSISYENNKYYPNYALNPDDEFRPFKALREILQLFKKSKSDWGIAYWFHSVNGYLDGICPKDLLAEEPEKVIGAARCEVNGIQHG